MYTEETKIFIALLTSAIILLIMVVFFAVSIVRYSKKRILLSQEEIKANTIMLDNERERIAADLHDDLGATLSAIKIQLQCIDVTEQDLTVLNESKKLLDDSMKKLKQISYNIAPLILRRKGLREAVLEFTDSSTFTSNLNIKLKYEIAEIPKERQIHLFRIVQEIINNTAKHAHATEMDINFYETKKLLVLQATDNGVGFNKTEIEKGQGVGLQNIMTRVQMFKGTIYLTTDNGVHYLIEIPKSL